MQKILSGIFGKEILILTFFLLVLLPSAAISQKYEYQIETLSNYLDSLLIMNSEISAEEIDNIERYMLGMYNDIYNDTTSIKYFETSLKSLIEKLNKSETEKINIKEIQKELNKLRQDPTSLLPAFYKLVHKSLQEKIYKLGIDTGQEVLIIDNEVAILGEKLERLYSIKSSIEEEKERERNNALDGLEIQGLVVNETQTKIGSDFYDLFYSKWQEPQTTQSFTIIVSEQPAPGLGSLVSVAIDENLIFQQRMQPRYEILDEMSDYAVQAAAQYIANYEDIQKQLQGDDLAGSGIF